MLKTKILVGLALTTCALAISAMPASALIKGTSGNTKGLVKDGESTLEGGGAGFKCVTTEGTWTIPKATGSSEEKQNVEKWNKCAVTKPELLKGLEIKVAACSFTLEQPTKSTTPTGQRAKIETGCAIKAPAGCEITVAKEAANEGLLEWAGENNSTKDLVKGNIKGITEKVTKPCEEVGVTSTNGATLKAPKVEYSEQNFE